MSISPSARSRLRLADALMLAASGLFGRRLRAVLAALGVAIGVAAVVAILGLSASSEAHLMSALNRIGSNLLRVTPGQDTLSGPYRLPATARASAIGVAGVTDASAVSGVADLTVRRSPFIPLADTSGISVGGTDSLLPRTLGIEMSFGVFLDRASGATPSVVLGAKAARRLGVHTPGEEILVGDRWFTVIGVMRPVLLDDTLDAMALVGDQAARHLLQRSSVPTTVYVRTTGSRIDDVRELLAPSISPQNPSGPLVSRPSDAIAAKAAAEATLTGVFLGLGAVALLVGAIGIANVMVISVLERRAEIGLRRAIGATRRHIAAQFLAEASLLAVLGGVAGSALGLVLTGALAANRGWPFVVPLDAIALGVGASIVVGVVAGAYPALRAGRLPPTDALRA